MAFFGMSSTRPPHPVHSTFIVVVITAWGDLMYARSLSGRSPPLASPRRCRAAWLEEDADDDTEAFLLRAAAEAAAARCGEDAGFEVVGGDRENFPPSCNPRRPSFGTNLSTGEMGSAVEPRGLPGRGRGIGSGLLGNLYWFVVLVCFVVVAVTADEDGCRRPIWFGWMLLSLLFLLLLLLLL